MSTENYSFVVDSLGKTNIDSPLGLSEVVDGFGANYVSDDDLLRYSIDAETGTTTEELTRSHLLEKAGPRKKIFFNPQHVHAVIATCGGLCPGINDVIRALVRGLWNRYGVRRITGVRYGYKGFLADYHFTPVELNPDVVDDIHKVGGSFLGTSRGGGNRTSDIVDGIEQMNANVVFFIGGDGTQKGALAVAEEIKRRKMTVGIIGIPKTIDNDLSFIDKTFGFDTAVGQATEAVSSAHMEAHSQINGTGLVKLMGRESGFIAAYTAIASHETNFVLIPELPFQLEGENGLLEQLRKRLEQSEHAVVVVAEGAGQHLLHNLNETDASGNKRLADIGIFLKEQIEKYFKENDIHSNVKYIDPSYQIRSAVAAPIDSIYCERLGNNAVHAAMAGKTKMIVGVVHNEFVHLPMETVTRHRNYVDPKGSLWRDVLDATGQPLLLQ